MLLLEIFSQLHDDCRERGKKPVAELMCYNQTSLTLCQLSVSFQIFYVTPYLHLDKDLAPQQRMLNCLLPVCLLNVSAACVYC